MTERAIVTGACSAIGRAIQRELFEHHVSTVPWCRCSGVDLAHAIPQIDCYRFVHVAEVGPEPTAKILTELRNKFDSHFHFVLISSVHHLSHDDEYARSKREQERLVKDFALRLGARCNILRLGHIKETRQWPVEDKARTKEIPLGHFGDPKDVGRAAYYLLNSDWHCGAVLDLDGGMHLSV